MAFLKIGLENVFRQQSNNSSSALRAGYRVAYLLAKESKPFSSVVRKCFFNTYCMRIFWKRNLFNTVSSLSSTMTWRVGTKRRNLEAFV